MFVPKFKSSSVSDENRNFVVKVLEFYTIDVSGSYLSGSITDSLVVSQAGGLGEQLISTYYLGNCYTYLLQISYNITLRSTTNQTPTSTKIFTHSHTPIYPLSLTLGPIPIPCPATHHPFIPLHYLHWINPTPADYLHLNKLQHSLNGNIRKYFQRYSDILFQNIPWNKNVQDLQIALDILLSKSPAILAIGETDFSKLQACHFPGYTLIQGRQTQPINNKIRINILIKTGLDYEEVDLTNEIPTCAVLYGGWTISFCYREWAKGGSPPTQDIPQQNDRWDTMVPQWRTLTGSKSMLIGDLNYCIKNGNTQYQRRFDHIRDSIMENFLLDGWSQLVQDETRHQKGDSPSLLDHVYVTDYSYIERVYNHTTVDSDHNTVGVRLRHDGQVHAKKMFESRDIEGIDQEEFERLF